MRPTCLECAGKHIAQACVLSKEAKTGYPTFRWFVVGHLAEAEEETVREHPEFANEIREHRVAYTEDEAVIVPFEELLGRVDELLTEQSAMDPDETQKIERGAEGTEPSPVGEFGQPHVPKEGDLGSTPL